MSDRGIFQDGKNDLVGFRIKPYIQEATIQLIIDILMIIFIAILLAVLGFHFMAYALLAFVYLIVAVFLHYKTLIQALSDKRNKANVTEIVSIQGFINEYSFAGNRLGNSHIRFFYPKDMQVNRYKIKAVNENGEKKVLRSVMSFRRSFILATLDKYQISNVKATYLKKSKILLSIELVDELDKKTNRKTREKIDKAIHFINTAI